MHEHHHQEILIGGQGINLADHLPQLLAIPELPLVVELDKAQMILFINGVGRLKYLKRMLSALVKRIGGNTQTRFGTVTLMGNTGRQ